MPTIDYGHLDAGGNRFPYYLVGDGPTPLVVFSGLNDALQPADPSRLGAEYLGRWLFRRYTDDYTVLVLSRPRDLPRGTTTRDMADDYADAVAATVDDPASVLGVSMGGLIAQHFAADHPELVDRLVVGTAGVRLGREERQVVDRWRRLAEADDWTALYADSADAYVGLRRHLYPPLVRRLGGAMPTPAAPSDVVASCVACLAHEGTHPCSRVKAPTLVLGGTEDRYFPPSTLREAASTLPDGRLELLDGAGHLALAEQGAVWDRALLDFLGG
ncbi:alpha/beta fold hydrolase [Halobium salinum]|uniref:Alpha/beta fold hydrolase n=1 Tax=Halobium salinum TaxID=1364940 RepID=A0ABD5P6K9_9EURY|nr:alpha/beta fold hydrolase [Halobium salinum]